MFKTEAIAMNMQYSKQRDYFYGAIGLLVVGALASALAGSSAGCIAIATLTGLLLTRAHWTRILMLVVTAYSGLVSLLVAIFAHGSASLGGFIAAFLSGGIFWLLIRPGMDGYFGANPTTVSRVLPVMPRPGALPHLQECQAGRISPLGPAMSAPKANTQQQWDRLQRQLRAEREREAAMEEPTIDPTRVFHWFTLPFAVLAYAQALSVSGSIGQFSLLVVIPALIATLLRWLPLRGFLLGILVVSGGLILAPEWNIVAPRLQALLLHHGPLVFAGVVLLVYVIALSSSGFVSSGENHA